jgi:F0F1-type ATP synthase membrane subunit a
VSAGTFTTPRAAPSILLPIVAGTGVIALAAVVPFAILFYVFEVGIVVGIQAFIFAALSAIYIGSAIEPEH